MAQENLTWGQARVAADLASMRDGVPRQHRFSGENDAKDRFALAAETVEGHLNQEGKDTVMWVHLSHSIGALLVVRLRYGYMGSELREL